MKTVLDVIRATTDYFAKNGVESPRLNVEHLLAHVLGKRRMDLYLEFERPLTEAELAPLRDLVRRRAGGEPLQYLLGTVEFLKHNLLCDARALIPRPETEELATTLIAAGNAGAPWATGHIADIGTGTGCLAIALAAAFPNARVTAADISPDALSLARENAQRCALADRVSFVESDLLSAVNPPVDLLVANLPYIPTALLSGLQREVLREPPLALDGGPDGLALVHRLLGEAATKLAPAGHIALELHHDQPSALAAALTGKFTRIEPRRDLAGNERFLFLEK